MPGRALADCSILPVSWACRFCGFSRQPDGRPVSGNSRLNVRGLWLVWQGFPGIIARTDTQALDMGLGVAWRFLGEMRTGASWADQRAYK
jgi:hypothetical protein